MLSNGWTPMEVEKAIEVATAEYMTHCERLISILQNSTLDSDSKLG